MKRIKQTSKDQLGKHSKPRKLSRPCILGVDEAGRGAWAGPVVAACVMWSGRNPIKGILHDSKKMSPKERETTFKEIHELAKLGKIFYGIGVIGSAMIDAVGIREANRLAMQEALLQINKAQSTKHKGGFFSVIPGEGVQAGGTSEDPESRRITTRPVLRSSRWNKDLKATAKDESEPCLLENKDSIIHLDSGPNVSLTSSMKTSVRNDGKVRILIDGRDNYTFDLPDLPTPEYIIRGDSKVKQIMAASILAKVTRDRLMAEFEKTLPGYGFARHKGYGTKYHQNALQKLGICEIHRRSYRPMAFFCQKFL